MPFTTEDGRPWKGVSYTTTDDWNNKRLIYRVLQTTIYWRAEEPGVKIRIPEGYLSDLASIPALPFLPKPGGTLWDDAAIVHDRACDMAKDREISFEQADAIFYHAMRERGCTIFTATVLWSAVRAFHLSQGKR